MNMFAIPGDESLTQYMHYGIALTFIMAAYVGLIRILAHHFAKTHAGLVLVRMILCFCAILVSAVASSAARLIIRSMNSGNIPLIFLSVLIGSFLLINILATSKDPPSAPRGGT